MAVYTDVGADELDAFIDSYDIGEVLSYKGIAEGVENSNFLLHTERGHFILTLYEKRVAARDLPFFLGLMEHLASRGLTCPQPVKNRKGEILGKVGGRPAAIVTFLEGMWMRRPDARHCAAVGEALETVHAEQLDAHYDLLAHHFSRAEEPGRALTYLVHLADQAARSYALEEAVRALRDGLAVSDRLPADERGPRRLEVVYRMASALAFLGRPVEGRDLLLQHEDLVAGLGQPRLSGIFYFWLAYLYGNLGNSGSVSFQATGEQGHVGGLGLQFATQAFEGVGDGLLVQIKFGQLGKGCAVVDRNEIERGHAFTCD